MSIERPNIPDYLAPEFISVSLRLWEDMQDDNDELERENAALKDRVRKLEQVLKGVPNG
jgi:cell division protein FtsB